MFNQSYDQKHKISEETQFSDMIAHQHSKGNILKTSHSSNIRHRFAPDSENVAEKNSIKTDLSKLQVFF